MAGKIVDADWLLRPLGALAVCGHLVVRVRPPAAVLCLDGGGGGDRVDPLAVEPDSVGAGRLRRSRFSCCATRHFFILWNMRVSSAFCGVADARSGDACELAAIHAQNLRGVVAGTSPR